MIIGITGKKSSGKDTIAEYLCEQYGFVKLSFAALLKQSAAALFDIDPAAWESYKNDPLVRIELWKSNDQQAPGDIGLLQTSMSAREFLQRYGTEAHREVFGQDFWVDAMWSSWARTYGTGGDFVIPDTRFRNEAQSVTNHCGVVWRVVRPGQDEADGHASEDLSQTDPFVSLEIQNDGGFEKLYNAVDEALEVVFTG